MVITEEQKKEAVKKALEIIVAHLNPGDNIVISEESDIFSELHKLGVHIEKKELCKFLGDELIHPNFRKYLMLNPTSNIIHIIGRLRSK